MMRRLILMPLVAAAAVALSFAAQAEVEEVRLSRTTTMAYLPLFIAQHEKLIEKHAAANGMPDLKVSWLNFTGPSAQIDALLSDNVDIVATGSTGLITLWAKTKGSSLEVKGLTALSSMPIVLNSRNPNVKTIADLTDTDRIAVPSVKVSFNATLLQMAAAKEWGMENYDRLDKLTVGLGQMDAVAAMMSTSHEVNHDMCTPPFLYIEQQQPGIHPVISSVDILGEKGTIATGSTTSRFHDENPTVIKIYRAAVAEAMEIIANDKSRAIDGYVAATNDTKTPKDMLIKIISDPNSEFTTVPRAMKSYGDFMAATGVIKEGPAAWSDMFFPGVAEGGS